MDFFLQFPPHKSNTQQKKAGDSTKQKRTGAGGAWFGCITLLRGIIGFLHHGMFITSLQIQIPPKIESCCWN